MEERELLKERKIHGECQCQIRDFLPLPGLNKKISGIAQMTKIIIA